MRRGETLAAVAAEKKGILDPEDAKDAVCFGADGIIVSNQGGRQLDGVLSSARAMPAIADAVKSDIRGQDHLRQVYFPSLVKYFSKCSKVKRLWLPLLLDRLGHGASYAIRLE